MNKKFIKIILISLISLISLNLIGCHSEVPNTLSVGTLSGPETELMDIAQKVAQERYGLNVKVIEFNDYHLPNIALADGTIDANVYQHLPYLKDAIAANNYKFEVIGKTFLYPTGIYSLHFKTPAALPNNATIAIPNDPSNEIRALKLLAQAKLIILKSTDNPTLNDIIANPKNLQFKSLDAAQLPRVLVDVDAAIINTTFALPAKLKLYQDTLWVESKTAPYANLIVTRINSNKKDQLELLVKALHSKEVLEKAKLLFGNAALAAW